MDPLERLIAVRQVRLYLVDWLLKEIKVSTCLMTVLPQTSLMLLSTYISQVVTELTLDNVVVSRLLMLLLSVQNLIINLINFFSERFDFRVELEGVSEDTLLIDTLSIPLENRLKVLI